MIELGTIPEAFVPLLSPARYKVYYGGRGSAKSWQFGRVLLMRGIQQSQRTLCAREYQNSIDDSVYLLLRDQIERFELFDYYTVLRDEIVSKVNGTMFAFEGLHGRSIDSLKSFEGADVAWVEEANTVSKRSWDILTPTIRKDGSEIWVSFNPELSTDETYKRFVLNPPPNAITRAVTWRDNPFFSDVLREEMEHAKASNYDDYLWIWEGKTKVALDGAVYASELRAAREQGRVTSVPYGPEKPVGIYWDLGRADDTSIWFIQQFGFQYRVIDFYTAHGYGLAHYVQLLKSKPYIYGECWLPHDAENEVLQSETTVAQQLRSHGFKPRIAPRQPVEVGIEAARAIFPRVVFDEQACADGLQALSHYRYKLADDGLSRSMKPVHDWASHPADAFRTFALSLKSGEVDRGKIRYDNRWIV